MKKAPCFLVVSLVAAVALAAGAVRAFETSNQVSASGASAPSGSLDNLPMVILDESAGDWVVDRFAGNSTAGPRMFQGPAREVGGLERVKETLELPDGSIYLLCGGAGGGGSTIGELARVTPDGQVHLLMNMDGRLEGPMEQCQAGRPLWNPREKALYLTGPNCLRKITEKPDGSKWVEVVAGLPNKEGGADGPAREATFQTRYRGVVCTGAGVFYWLEDSRLRKIENGTVSTIALNHLDDPRSFSFAMGGSYHGLLSIGESDDVIYISDYYGYYNFRVLKVDLKTGNLIRVCGAKAKDTKRYGSNADGPALTHAAANSGMIGVYDPFHRALWVYGPDEDRFRWLRLDGDGWVRTVLGAGWHTNKHEHCGADDMNVPGSLYRSMWNGICGFDSRGGVYISQSGNRSGVWRAYNKHEVKP